MRLRYLAVDWAKIALAGFIGAGFSVAAQKSKMNGNKSLPERVAGRYG
jgi:hypothetical protein